MLKSMLNVKTLWLPAVCLVIVVGIALAIVFIPEPERYSEPDAAELAGHKVAQATLAAHYIAAALDAGKSPDEINRTLRHIASETIISEFWVSDANGVAVYSSVPDTEFSFGMDPYADRQAAPFVHLLLGNQKTLVQEAQSRDVDGARFQYVGVAGVDSPRIVQVGFRRE